MGEAHKTIAEANALLAQTNAKLVESADELCKEIRHLKVDTPAKPAHSGGGRVTKHAATG